MISARIRQLLAYGIFSVTLVVASVSQGDAFEARIDLFRVIKNNVDLFVDTFGNGNPPPSGGPGFGYSTKGVFAEAGSKGIMNSDVGLPTFGRAGFVLDDPILFTSALLLTDIDNTNLIQGLKIDDTIEVRALFDLVAPQKKGDQYGIRLTDQTSTQAGDDVILLRVVKSSVTGNDLISFAKANFETGALDLAGSHLLEPGHDQILLRLRRPNTLDRQVFASYAYVDAGVIGSFTNLSNIGKSGNPITIFNGENFTQAQFNLLVRNDVTTGSLVSGSPASISQTVNTPGSPFAVSFVYRFESTAGVLTVSLDGTVLATIDAPTDLLTEFQSFSVSVSNSTLLGLTGASLTFEIDSDIPGSTVLLDNIQFPGLQNGNFTGGDLSNWVTVGNAGVLVVESPQDAEVDVRRADVKLKKKGDSFTITGRFITDPAVSDGINLPEDVSVVFNGFSQTIPATSFFRDDDNEGFQFNGTHGGIKHLKIRDDGSFRVMGQNVDLDGTDFANPVPFLLRIGNDLAQTEITVDVR